MFVSFFFFFWVVVGWMVDLFFLKKNRYLSATSVSDRENITWAGQVKFSFLGTQKKKTFISINKIFFSVSR